MYVLFSYTLQPMMQQVFSLLSATETKGQHYWKQATQVNCINGGPCS